MAGNRNNLTRGQLDRLLRHMGFETGKRTESCDAYYHAESETLILLPVADASEPVRPADLMSVRLRLVGPWWAHQPAPTTNQGHPHVTLKRMAEEQFAASA